MSEVENITKQFEYPLLSIQIRTWRHKFDPPNIFQLREGITRNYNFKTYKDAIDKFLRKPWQESPSL